MKRRALVVGGELKVGESIPDWEAELLRSNLQTSDEARGAVQK